MLKIAIIWLTLDAMAIVMLLYDYHRWYGKAHKLSPEPDETEAGQGLDITNHVSSSLTNMSRMASHAAGSAPPAT